MHHVTNVAWHVLNTLLLFGLLRAMTGALWRSAFVAALFAVHPAHVESVAWVSERKDVLSTCFWLLTTWAWVAWVRRPSAGRMAIAAGRVRARTDVQADARDAALHAAAPRCVAARASVRAVVAPHRREGAVLCARAGLERRDVPRAAARRRGQRPGRAAAGGAHGERRRRLCHVSAASRVARRPGGVLPAHQSHCRRPAGDGGDAAGGDFGGGVGPAPQSTICARRLAVVSGNAWCR